MNTIAWSFINALAQCLEPEEREAALGDIVEARESSWQALGNIFGLVARRHLDLWKSWRPWLAAFALAVPASLLLMGLSVSVSLACQKLLSPTAATATGPPFAQMLGNIVMLFLWSWTCGFVMASVSRRTVWVSAVVSLMPCLFCLSRFRIAALSPLSLFLFLAPAIWGLRRGLRVAPIGLTSALGLALVLALLTIPTWNAAGPWSQNRFLIWPAWYLILVARKGAQDVGLKRQADGK